MPSLSAGNSVQQSLRTDKVLSFLKKKPLRTLLFPFSVENTPKQQQDMERNPWHPQLCMMGKVNKQSGSKVVVL